MDDFEHKGIQVDGAAKSESPTADSPGIDGGSHAAEAAEVLKETPGDDEARGGEPPKKSKKKYIFSALFMVILIGVTFYIIFKDNSLPEIFGYLKDVNLWFIAVGVGVMLLYLCVQGWAIGLAGRCINVKFRFREMFQYSCLGFFYSGITPSSSGGQPLQFYYIARDKMSASRTTLVLFMTNITYQLSMVLISLLAFTLVVGEMVQSNSALVVLFIFGLSINFLAFLLLVGIMFWEKLTDKIIIGVINILSKLHIVKHSDQTLAKVHKYMSNFKAGVELIKERKWMFAAILGVTILQLLLYDVIPFFVYEAFGLTGYSWVQILSMNAVLFVCVSFIPLPGAVGASETGFSLLFKSVFGAMIVPAMLLSRFVNFYTILLLTGAVAIFVQMRKPYNLASKDREISPDKRKRKARRKEEV